MSATLVATPDDYAAGGDGLVTLTTDGSDVTLRISCLGPPRGGRVGVSTDRPTLLQFSISSEESTGRALLVDAKTLLAIHA